MRTRVKICGITRPQDAQVALAAGVDALGLVFYPPSSRALSLEQAERIAAEVPPLVSLMALFVDPEPVLVEQVLERVRPDLLQFHGGETAAFCASFGRPYLKAVAVRQGLDFRTLEPYEHSARGLLLDAYDPKLPGGTGHVFDWALVPEALADRIVLAGGLTPANVGQAIGLVHPWGVDVSGGVEAAPGIKDPQLITAFMQEVKRADQS